MSYALLTPNEQSMFHRLAVFAGGTLVAVEAICADASPGLGALNVLEALAEQSLLRLDEFQAADGASRLIMLEIVHELAAERLVESGKLLNLRRRHATFFVAFAQQAASQLDGPDQNAWPDRLDSEHVDLHTRFK